jgi:deoxyribodipyrimidine photo-lyase
MIPHERIKKLNHLNITEGEYVLYWIQSSPRIHYNHALEYAIEIANKIQKPLITYFGLSDNFPDATRRHYYFLLEGLQELEKSLNDMGIKLIVKKKNPSEGAVEISKQASMVILDRGYLKLQKKWYKNTAKKIQCPLIQVETNVVVPVETASPKEEYSAATIRKKIKTNLQKFMVPIENNKPIINSINLELESESLKDIEKVISVMEIDNNVKETPYFHGGTSNAIKHLEYFLNNKIDHFKDLRNDPSNDYLSNMSPYLHFGHISPLYIALKVLEIESPGKEAYLEELIVRRELAMNFIFYNQNYDNFSSIPEWARKTLLEHKNDKREYNYTLEDLINLRTHDEYWNAAQNEMMIKGKMHGYMRMYWGKKILEWTEDPKQAYKIALYLNNRYELDGRDPNGFTGVAWCFGKHDRAWKEREIFGKVRYMNANGLRRKFKIEKYVENINKLK